MDTWDILEQHARLADKAAAERRARRAAWIKRERRAGRWGEVDQLRDLVRRLTSAYQVAGADNLELLREALAAVEAMPPPPWETAVK